MLLLSLKKQYFYAAMKKLKNKTGFVFKTYEAPESIAI